MKNKTHLYFSTFYFRPALLIILALFSALAPAAIFGKDRSPREDFLLKDDFDKKLSEGRDLIDREQWAEAAKKFKDLIEKYPKNKSIDAALYWLAFCYKKQKQYAEAEAVVTRLINEYPASSWANDAQVMKLEIARPPAIYGAAKTVPGAPGFEASYGQFSKTFEFYPALSGFGTLSPAVPLEREDEIRLAALQSLLKADLNRGLEAIPPLFQNDKAGENLKVNVLRALRRPTLLSLPPAPLAALSIAGELPPAPPLSPASPLNAGRPQAAIRQTLMKIYPDEKNVKLRKEILGTLSSLGDSETIDSLAQLYATENDREIKKSILSSLGQTGGGFAPALKKLNAGPGAAFSKLLEIMRAERDPELKNLALVNLQRFSGFKKDEQFAQTLVEMYDGETGEDLKLNIIETLASIEVRQATKKLLEIAKNEKADKLRLEAIRHLGRSKDPEALKYLEDLIK